MLWFRCHLRYLYKILLPSDTLFVNRVDLLYAYVFCFLNCWFHNSIISSNRQLKKVKFNLRTINQREKMLRDIFKISCQSSSIILCSRIEVLGQIHDRWREIHPLQRGDVFKEQPINYNPILSISWLTRKQHNN